MQPNEEFQRLVLKRTNFLGTVRLKLRHLNVEHQGPEDTYLDPKNVTRLLGVFKLEGCLRLNEEHHVPAIINRGAFQDALIASEVQAEKLLSPQGGDPPPELKLPADMKITCLHGKHRLAAAHQFLGPGDKWWMVSLYSDGMSLTAY